VSTSQMYWIGYPSHINNNKKNNEFEEET